MYYGREKDREGKENIRQVLTKRSEIRLSKQPLRKKKGTMRREMGDTIDKL